MLQGAFDAHAVLLPRRQQRSDERHAVRGHSRVLEVSQHGRSAGLGLHIQMRIAVTGYHIRAMLGDRLASAKENCGVR